jgi:Fe2+ transport system protein B
MSTTNPDNYRIYGLCGGTCLNACSALLLFIVAIALGAPKNRAALVAFGVYACYMVFTVVATLVLPPPKLV